MCGIAAVVESAQELAWPDWPFWSGSQQRTQLHDLPSPSKLTAAGSQNLESLMAVLARRGPDFQMMKNMNLGCGTRIALLGAVLSLRGENPVPQPACDGEDSLLFNGEAYDSLVSDIGDLGTEDICDTTVLLRQLKAAGGDGEKILKFLDSIRGPWSIIYWHHNTKRLYFGRDVLGRRSLLMKIEDAGQLTVASTVPAAKIQGFVEVPPAGLFFLDLSHSASPLEVIRRNAKMFKSFQHASEDEQKDDGGNNRDPTNLENDPQHVSFLPTRWLRSSPSEELQRNALSIEASALMFLSIFETSLRRRLTLSARRTGESGPRFAVLFSGGIDSLFLTLMLDKCMDVHQGLDLINVAFGCDTEVSSCPDRVNAEIALLELRKLVKPGRLIRLILVDVPPHEADYALRDNVRPLIYPCDQLMDDSIGTALWFAGRARGRRAPSTRTERHPGNSEIVCSSARIMFSGLGADELMGGYKGRHRTTFRREGESGILSEMDKDLSRLWYRNLGRDDRVVSDSGRELRHPFLDEDVIDFVTRLPVTEHVCDLSLPDGVGDKHLLRRAAEKLGLGQAATSRSKRAIQFGSRSKHVLERKK